MTSALILLVAAAVVAGIAGGLFGIGGGTVLVPAYLLILTHLGVPEDSAAKIAIATSLATIILLASGSVHGHHRAGTMRFKDVLWLAAGGMTGAFIGSWIALEIPGSWLIASFGGFCIFIGGRMLLTERNNANKQAQEDSEPVPEKGDPPMPALTLVGGTAGLMSSLFGIGGGVVAVPLMLFVGLPIHRAIASSSGMIILNSLAGTLAYLWAVQPILPPEAALVSEWSIGYVNWPAALLVGFLAYFCARLGARLAHLINAEKLKRLFALFLIGLGVTFVTRII